MNAIKQKYTEAVKAVAEIEAERRKLVAHTDAALEEAKDRVDAIENEFGGDFSRCEGCENYIFPGDMHSHDSINSIDLCEECSPTWQDLADDPGNFTNGADEYRETIYLTKETAAPIIAKHIAAGGKMSDKFGLRAY